MGISWLLSACTHKAAHGLVQFAHLYIVPVLLHARTPLALNYGEVLYLSSLFYEAQRAGALPSSNRIPWRGDSALKDGSDKGLDLSGGWYDAGDHLKFALTTGFTVSTLAWSLLEFPDAYDSVNGTCPVDSSWAEGMCGKVLSFPRCRLLVRPLLNAPDVGLPP